jgi:hypothetical protein
METKAISQNKRQKSSELHKGLFKLTFWGGITFFAITIIGSMFPMAAEFRAALSISYLQVVVIDSLLVGMIISFCLSYLLLRFFEKIPTSNPIIKSEILSFASYVIVLILLGVASSLTNDTLNIFLIGAMLNALRFFFLGLVIGFVYKKMSNSAKNIIN